MGFLSEDATYLAGGLAMLAVVFLVALRTSQQGKFLIWAGIVLGLAALVLLIERLWVTDNERIEQVVLELRDAVANSNPPAVFALLTPEVQFVQGGQSISGEATRNYIETELKRAHFDFVRVTKLQTNAGSQSGRGSAEFRVVASGTYELSLAKLNFGTTNLDFSLGFRELDPKVWRVDRITLTRAPRELPNPIRGANSGSSPSSSSSSSEPRPRLPFNVRP
jgi:hypothetical protein